MHSETLVLLSGGTDSMAVAHFYKDLGHTVSGLFINYGQLSHSQELIASQAVANYLNIEIQQVSIPKLNSSSQKTGFIQGRNLLLLAIGISAYQGESGTISLGVHKGSGYSDCSPFFITKSQAICDLYFDGRVSIGAPFVTWDKLSIYEYCMKNALPFDLTYSCEKGNPTPCGICNSCKDRELLNVS